MEIVEKIDGTVLILTISGEIDLNQSPTLRTTLREKAKAKTPRLLLDFAAVAYVDSSGLATLIEYYQSSKAYAGKMAICSLVPRVRSSFDLVRLSEVFSIFPDQAEARKALAGGSA
jgi:anti-sigma B factor antagonist